MVNGGTLTVPQAVALASGTTPIASTGRAIVVRIHGDKPEQINVALKNENKGEEAAFVLHDGDMLYILTSGIKAAFVNSSVILSSAASAGIYAATK